MRRADFVVRLGGDEFLVVLPDADRSSTARVARGVEAMMREPFVIAGQAVSVNCSVGEACCATQEGLEEEIAEADAAMYAAKALSPRGACSSSTPAA